MQYYFLPIDEQGFYNFSEISLVGAPLIILVVILSLSLAVRRAHDFNRRGWFVAIRLLPVIGFIADIILILWWGSKSENKYGQKPLPKIDLEVFLPR